jgi:hypothetical protein
MADMYHRLPQNLTGPGGDQKELRVKYIDNLDGTWSLAIGALVLPLPDGAATSLKQDTTNTKLDSVISALAGGTLVPEAYDEIVLTYVPSGNGVGEIATAVYKLDAATVATLTLSYNGDDKLSGVVRT